MSETLPDPMVRGLALSRWVAVEAALAEGLSLSVALAEIGWSPGRFRAAATGWKLRMVDDAALLPSYEAHLAAAQDRLTRPVLPIDSDLSGWVGFLKAYEAASDAGAWLTSLGLRAADLARLSRRWKARLAANGELAKEAEKLAKKSPPPALPALQIGRHALAPAAVDAETEAAPEALGWDLWRWASVQAELRVFTAHRGAVLSRHDLDEPSYSALEAGFVAVLAQDAQLRADYARLFGHAERRLRAFADGPPPSRRAPRSKRLPPVVEDPPAPAASPSPSRDLRETAQLDQVLLRAALPFAQASSASAPRVHYIRTRSALSGQTGDLPKLAARPTLPFSAPNKLATTAPTVDVPREALPFAKPKSKLAKTNMALNVPRHLFTQTSETKPPAPTPAPSTPPPPRASLAPAAPASTAPPPRASTPPEAALPMPLLRHASLHAELALFPQKRAEVLVRYRVDEDELSRADRYFRERFAQEPELYRAWHNGYTTYAAWLRGGG